MFVGMLAAYTVVFAGLAAAVCLEKWKKYYIAEKVASSIAFLAVLCVAAYQSGAVVSFWLMLPAFFCCFAGDIFLALYNCYRKRIHFLMGLGIFLAGHLCFVRWLCEKQAIFLPELLCALAGVGISWYLVSRKDIHTGRLKPFILLYTFFVALFFAKGQRLMLSEPTLQNGMIAAGSALFLVSDISILFLYFRKRKSVGIHLFNLTTYYYGMFFLAAQLLFL